MVNRPNQRGEDYRGGEPQRGEGNQKSVGFRRENFYGRGRTGWWGPGRVNVHAKGPQSTWWKGTAKVVSKKRRRKKFRGSRVDTAFGYQEKVAKGTAEADASKGSSGI